MSTTSHSQDFQSTISRFVAYQPQADTPEVSLCPKSLDLHRTVQAAKMHQRSTGPDRLPGCLNI